MINVNEDLTRQVAQLARLELSEEEVRTFTPQLQEIIRYVDQLQNVNVEGVEPMQGLETEVTPVRADEARPSPTDAEGKPMTLSPAPETQGDGFKVPPII